MTRPSPVHNIFHVPSRESFCDAAVAIIVLDDGRYLMQLRDNKAGIFYPDHWGFFGGAIEDGEDAETALRRELREETGYDTDCFEYFTSMKFDFETLGAKNVIRKFYELRLTSQIVDKLELGEGQAMQAMTATEILLEKRVVPYDSFAIWMHCARKNQEPIPLGTAN